MLKRSKPPISDTRIEQYNEGHRLAEEIGEAIALGTLEAASRQRKPRQNGVRINLLEVEWICTPFFIYSKCI